MLSCEELNGQYILLQQRCTDQGAELAQARADHNQVCRELVESQSKVCDHGCIGGSVFRCVLNYVG